MPRKAREKSNLCIYHVILRGINKQIIFEDEYDYSQFIGILKYYKKRCGFRLYAYCIMNNHVHLLIENTTDDLEIIMKKIEVKFVRWYNQKYQRTGHLFQDRFKSEPVNDMRYFQTVFRYIHWNPLRAGLETALGSYLWSSYNEYADLDDSFVDVDKVLDLFSDHKECMDYLHTDSDEKCMEYAPHRLSDLEALDIIRKNTYCDSPSDFQRLEISVRNRYLNVLFEAGISIRQLGRLTGLSRTVISDAVNVGSGG